MRQRFLVKMQLNNCGQRTIDVLRAICGRVRSWERSRGNGADVCSIYDGGGFSFYWRRIALHVGSRSRLVAKTQTKAVKVPIWDQSVGAYWHRVIGPFGYFRVFAPMGISNQAGNPMQSGHYRTGDYLIRWGLKLHTV